MKKVKNKINWFYILFGLFLIINFFYSSKLEIQEDQLTSKTIILSGIQDIDYHKSSISYRLWSNQFKCSFVIRTPGAMHNRLNIIDGIIKGDTVNIKIKTDQIANLQNETEDISIYFLSKNDIEIYDLEDYIESQHDYDRRLGIIGLVIGVLLTLRGLTIVSNKVATILGISSAIIIVLLRFLNIW